MTSMDEDVGSEKIIEGTIAVNEENESIERMKDDSDHSDHNAAEGEGEVDMEDDGNTEINSTHDGIEEAEGEVQKPIDVAEEEHKDDISEDEEKIHEDEEHQHQEQGQQEQATDDDHTQDGNEHGDEDTKAAQREDIDEVAHEEPIEDNEVEPEDKQEEDKSEQQDEQEGNEAEEEEEEEQEQEQEEDEEEDEDEDEDDEDNEPPILKYSRVSKLSNLFSNKDAISACLSHDSIIVIGTHSGFIHMMTREFSPIRSFRAHRASVLSLHTDGEYIASGSMDGTVAIGSLADSNDIIAYDFKRPIHAVVLEGQYTATKSFITGGTSGKVILSSRNWLGQRVDTVLEEPGGVILKLYLFGDLLLWLGEKGIQFYRLSGRTMIYSLKLPKHFPRPDLYWPNCEIYGDMLLIGWANTIWAIKLIELSANDSKSIYSSRSQSRDRAIHVDKQIRLEDTLIAGLSVYKDNYICLNYTAAEVRQNKPPPELKIISAMTLDDLSVDEVELKNHSSLGANDYHLVRYAELAWLIVSPNDVILVEEFDSNDRLKWYLDKGDYHQAWLSSSQLMESTERYHKIAVPELKFLVKADDWDTAKNFLAEVAVHIEDNDLQKQIWERWAQEFINAGEYDSIIDVIPDDIQLDSIIYEKCIDHYLLAKDPKFIDLVNTWNHSWFDTRKINNSIGTLLNDYDQGDLSEIRNFSAQALRDVHIELSIELGEFSHAAVHYFQAKDSSTLSFISEHHILRPFFDRIPEAVIIDLARDEVKFLPVETVKEKVIDRVNILIENRHDILPEEILKLMRDHDLQIVSFFYLQLLFDTPGFISTKYEDEMAELISIYDPDHLLKFLQKYRSYDIERAIDICEKQKLIKELVFLYSKIGENKKALDLVINDLKDPYYAISFTMSLKDAELFEHLLEYSASRPKFIKALIVEAGKNNDVDPEKIISRIPSGVVIENLKETLIHIMSGNGGDALINSLVLKIVEDEAMSLVDSVRDFKLKGKSFDPAATSKLLDGETIIWFCKDKHNVYKESEILTEQNRWPHIARTISDKLKHFIYIKTKRSILLTQTKNKIIFPFFFLLLIQKDKQK